ncbi:MAG: glycosyltransferase [Gammaproteobacteria bacterium]|nr:glycosyltransferase [Gammaproteobacteria bacterium]
MNGEPRRLAVLVSFSGDGGVERMMINLLCGMAAHGTEIDLLLIKAASTRLDQLPSTVRIIRLGSRHTFANLPALVRYLRAARPSALLAAKHRALLLALWARRLSGIPVRVVGRIGTTVSAALEGKSRFRYALWAWSVRRFYPRADVVVAVSEGVADDIRAMGATAARLQVIRNPVVTPGLEALARETPPHPWLTEPAGPPVILGMGRFTEQKDFATLIRAFARVRASRACRLILLGRGRLQSVYEMLATQLGVAEDIAFPGFAENPYSFLACARLFVLSSAWEGSPNALTEALALGVPVVSTDCPSGPRELLDAGRYGALVPVGDDVALARAMAATLDDPLPAAELRPAAAEYTVESSARAYLAALGMIDRGA